MPKKTLLFLTVALALAGCIAPGPIPEATPDASPAVRPAPLEHEARVWFPPALPTEGAVVEVDIRLDHLAEDLSVALRKGLAPGAPASFASAMATLLAADGTPLAEAMLSWGGPEEATLAAADLSPGLYRLRLTLYGASLADRLGHFIDWRLVATFSASTSGDAA